MNKVVPENIDQSPDIYRIRSSEDEEIEVPKLQIDPIENNVNNPKHSKTSSTKHRSSKSQSYIDLINLETTVKQGSVKQKENENGEMIDSKDLEQFKDETSSKGNEEKDSNNEIGNDSNTNNAGAQITEPIIARKKNLDKKRTLRIDSNSFLKKPLSAGIYAQFPIDKLSLMIDKENERYISQSFDFKFGSDKSWLNVTIINEFLSNQENIEIKTYTSNDEIPYKWDLKDLYKHEEGSCLFGKVYEAVDFNTNTKYILKIVDYELLDLVALHDFLYNILICRYLTAVGGYENILKVYDLYIAEHEDIFEGIKHHVLVIVLEHAPMSLSHLINIRKQKQLKWKDEELLAYLGFFFEELQKIYVNTGWCCEIDPLNIFYSITSNSLKLSNFRKRATTMHIQGEEMTWNVQIKTLYNCIASMKALNNGTIPGSARKTVTVKRSESDGNLKEEALGKSTSGTLLMDLIITRPEDYKEFEGRYKAAGELKKCNEHLVYEIFYVNEKKDNTENMIKNFSFFSKKYEVLLQYTQAFECYEKVIKYRQNDLQLNEKSFLKIKYYMGYIFFQTGYFEEGFIKLKEVIEILSTKYLDEYNLMVDIEIIFGMIDKQKKEIDSAIKHFESALQILRKNGQLSNLKTSQILIYLGYLYDVFGLNLSQIKKAHRFYSEALNIRKLILKNKYQNNLVQLINNLGIVSHKLEKYDQAIEFFEEVLAIEQKSENKARIANAKLNLGVIYIKNCRIMMRL